MPPVKKTTKSAPRPPVVAVAPPEVAVAPPEVAVAPPEVAVAPPEVAVAPPEVAVAPPEVAVAPPEVDSVDEDATDTEDFVTFSLGEELFAFPMGRVQEIIRMPETVKVPMTTHSLVGLANLRGRVLPVVSLRSCCRYPPVQADEATRVIIVDYGVPLGFVVDRVAAVVSVEPELIDSADSVQSTVDSRVLSGVIKQAGGELLAILDVAHVIDDEFDAIAQGLSAGTGVSDALGLTSAEVEEDESDDTFEMVSFIVDGQEYALPIDQIQEIVQASNSVSQVPNADPQVLGVMDLRGRLLPLVSLRRIFGLNQQPLDESSRIVVVPLRSDDGRDAAVGVVMDTVREVLRVPRDLVDAVPSIVARNGRETDVESVCRLDGGDRLVSVLSTDRLFSGRGLQAVIDNYDDGNAEDMADAGTVQESSDDDDDQQLVVFRVDSEEYCLGVDAVQEIIRVPEHLIKVPRALDFVEGLVNLRGTVLPVIDLRSRLGLSRCDRDDLQRIVVVIIAGVRTGFVVDAVAEVIKLDHSVVQPAPELSQAQARLISSVANLEDSQRMLMLLDHTQLLGGAELQALAEAA